MSASSDIQSALHTLLGQMETAVLGDGAVTEFTLTHSFGMQALPPLQVTVTESGALLVRDTDYSVEQTSKDALKITALNGAPAEGAWTAKASRLSLSTKPGAVGAPIPILERKTKSLANDIAAAAAKHGLSIYVMPSLPTKVLPGRQLIFVKEAMVRVALMEQPALNLTGIDVWELMDEVMKALHWQWPAMLKHPLYLAENPTQDAASANAREIHVKFVAVYGAAALAG